MDSQVKNSNVRSKDNMDHDPIIQVRLLKSVRNTPHNDKWCYGDYKKSIILLDQKKDDSPILN
jgi:hypothetical protein